jgi:general secretion pathway protein I
VRNRGFTLVEVLVALAIVAIGMAAVLGALTSSANTVSYLRDKTFAQWVALNQIATLRLSGQMTATGNSDGDTDYAGRTWHWRQEVTATEVPGVVRIDIKVRPKEVGGDDDNGWFTTVTGIQGDAVGLPNGFQPSWGVQSPFAQAGAGQPNPQGLGSTPQGSTPGSMPQGSMPGSGAMIMPSPSSSSQGLGSPITLDNDQQNNGLQSSDQPSDEQQAPPHGAPGPTDQQTPESPQ